MSEDAFTVPSLEPGVYEHYKGKRYEVVGIALHTESLEPMVLYKPLYETEVKYWVRPYEMFIGTLEIDGKEIARFRQIK